MPPLQLACSDDLRERLPLIAGALSVAIARALRNWNRTTPSAAEQWDRVDAVLEVVV